MAAKRSTKKAAKKDAPAKPPVAETAAEAASVAVETPTVLVVAEPTVEEAPVETPTVLVVAEPTVEAAPVVVETPPVCAVTKRAESYIKALLSQYGQELSGPDFPEIVAALEQNKQVVVTRDRSVEIIDGVPFAKYDRKVDVRGGRVLINVGRALVHAKHF